MKNGNCKPGDYSPMIVKGPIVRLDATRTGANTELLKTVARPVGRDVLASQVGVSGGFGGMEMSYCERRNPSVKGEGVSVLKDPNRPITMANANDVMIYGKDPYRKVEVRSMTSCSSKNPYGIR